MQCHTFPPPARAAADPHPPAEDEMPPTRPINHLENSRFPPWRGKNQKKKYCPEGCINLPIVLIFPVWCQVPGEPIYTEFMRATLCPALSFQSVSGHQTLMVFLELWVLYALFCRGLGSSLSCAQPLTPGKCDDPSLLDPQQACKHHM